MSKLRTLCLMNIWRHQRLCCAHLYFYRIMLINSFNSAIDSEQLHSLEALVVWFQFPKVAFHLALKHGSLKRTFFVYKKRDRIDPNPTTLLPDYSTENERRREGGKEAEGFAAPTGKGSFLQWEKNTVRLERNYKFRGAARQGVRFVPWECVWRGGAEENRDCSRKGRRGRGGELGQLEERWANGNGWKYSDGTLPFQFRWTSVETATVIEEC